MFFGVKPYGTAHKALISQPGAFPVPVLGREGRYLSSGFAAKSLLCQAAKPLDISPRRGKNLKGRFAPRIFN